MFFEQLHISTHCKPMSSLLHVVFCRGDFGRLGHGNSSDLFTPLPIKALHGVRIKQIACGDNHCLAVTMEGEVQRYFTLVSFSSSPYVQTTITVNMAFHP